MEEGKLHLRWGLTKAVARRLAELHPDRVLRYVDARELDHREHLADLARQYEVAYYYKRPAEISAMLEKFRNPIDVAELDCLRDWCGAAAVSSDMKLRKLEEDFIALALLARQAATEVRRLGTKKANQLAHEIESAASRNGTPAP
ncbi:MAG: hypothetical protein JWN36_520 [Microbacteriaceae bacterium]|nr:hypothetical protein [Microbacteriaceae bacterium]